MDTLSSTKEARLYDGKGMFSSKNNAGKTGQLHAKKKKLEHSLISYTHTTQNGLKILT